jgi:hypothetical protein
MTNTPAVRHRSWLAWAVIAAQLLLVGGMLILGAIEGHGDSAGRHDISDLGALTAHHATAERLIVGIAGAVTIAFALLVLRPSLRTTGGREPVGPWLGGALAAGL